MSWLNGLPCEDREGNGIYPDFRNMAKVESLMFCSEMGELEKTIACLGLFYGEEIPLSIEKAYSELIWFYSRGKELEKKKKKSVKLFDFEEDSDYILAAFHAAYNIDLADKDYHLHWWQFMSLFIALPEETQMMHRMQDRSVDTSQMKGETRKYYEARKKAVALKGKKQGETLQEREISRQKRLDELFIQAEKELEEQRAKEQ